MPRIKFLANVTAAAAPHTALCIKNLKRKILQNKLKKRSLGSLKRVVAVAEFSRCAEIL